MLLPPPVYDEHHTTTRTLRVVAVAALVQVELTAGVHVCQTEACGCLHHAPCAFLFVQIGDGEITVDDKSAIVTINAQGIIQLANKVACAMFG